MVNETPNRIDRGVRWIGTAMIVIGIVAVLINHTWSWTIGAVFAGVGVGLRIEAAITDVHSVSRDSIRDNV